MQGKSLAFKALCRIFVRNSQDRYPPEVLAHFYDAIRWGLTKYSGTEASKSIILTSVPIFALNLPGVNLLLPYFLKEIKVLVSNLESANDRVRERCILILGSLISIARHYREVPDMDLASDAFEKGMPTIEVKKDDKSVENVNVLVAEFGKSFSYARINEHIGAILETVLKFDSVSRHIHDALSVYGVLMCEEVHRATPDDRWLLAQVKILFGYTLTGKAPVAALRNIALLSLFQNRCDPVRESSSLSRDALLMVILIGAYCVYYRPTRGEYRFELQEQRRSILRVDVHRARLRVLFVVVVLEEHSATLLAWLQAMPVGFWDSRDTVQHVFASVQTVLTTPGVDPLVKDSVHRLLLNVLNFTNNFPTDGHYDTMTSKHMEEAEFDSALFANNNNLYSYSFLDVPAWGAATLIFIVKRSLLP